MSMEDLFHSFRRDLYSEEGIEEKIIKRKVRKY